MAFIENVFEGGTTGSLVGVGIGLATYTLFPLVGTVIRPLAKSVIIGYFALADAIKGITTEANEELSDFAAKAQDEPRPTSTTEKKTRSKKKTKSDTARVTKRKR